MRVVDDPAGRLIWIPPALPGAQHDIDTPSSTLPNTDWVTTLADTGGYRGWRARDPGAAASAPDTGRYRPLTADQKEPRAALLGEWLVRGVRRHAGRPDPVGAPWTGAPAEIKTCLHGTSRN